MGNRSCSLLVALRRRERRSDDESRASPTGNLAVKDPAARLRSRHRSVATCAATSARGETRDGEGLDLEDLSILIGWAELRT